MSKPVVKILVVRIGDEPKVEEVDNPFNFAKMSLLGGGFVQALPLSENLALYCDEDGISKKLRFNRDFPARASDIPDDAYDFVIDMTKGQRAMPGEMGFHRILGNFLITCHSGSGGYATLSEEEIVRFSKALVLSTNEGKCKRCGNPVAYDGGIFCGAGCTARYEAGD